jgi:hypothetical protein
VDADACLQIDPSNLRIGAIRSAEFRGGASDDLLGADIWSSRTGGVT